MENQKNRKGVVTQPYIPAPEKVIYHLNGQNNGTTPVDAQPGVTDGFIPAERVSGPYAGLRKGDVVLFYTDGPLDSGMAVTLEIPEAD